MKSRIARSRRGEGIFFQFSESEIGDWLARVQRLNLEFFGAHVLPLMKQAGLRAG